MRTHTPPNHRCYLPPYDRSIISSPTEAWEMAEPLQGQPAAVNEGPNPLYQPNRTWLSFSASWCGTPTYALGLLAYDGTGDPTSAASWIKSQQPAFAQANGSFVGTGHNVFFSSPDGREVWVCSGALLPNTTHPIV